MLPALEIADFKKSLKHLKSSPALSLYDTLYNNHKDNWRGAEKHISFYKFQRIPTRMLSGPIWTRRLEVKNIFPARVAGVAVG